MLTRKLIIFIDRSEIQWLCVHKTTLRKLLTPVIYDNAELVLKTRAGGFPSLGRTTLVAETSSYKHGPEPTTDGA